MDEEEELRNLAKAYLNTNPEAEAYLLSNPKAWKEFVRVLRDPNHPKHAARVANIRAAIGRGRKKDLLEVIVI